MAGGRSPPGPPAGTGPRGASPRRPARLPRGAAGPAPGGGRTLLRRAAPRRALPRRPARPHPAALPPPRRPRAQSRPGAPRPPDPPAQARGRRRRPVRLDRRRRAARARGRAGRAADRLARTLGGGRRARPTPGVAATRGARCGPAAGATGRPRLPGGQRPYVRAALAGRLAPDALGYDPEEHALCLGNGRISPVAHAAWEYRSGGVRVLESWSKRRATPGPAGTLDAIGPRDWPQEWTSDLLELITVLTLLAEPRAPTGQLRKELARTADRGGRAGRGGRAAGAGGRPTARVGPGPPRGGAGSVRAVVRSRRAGGAGTRDAGGGPTDTRDRLHTGPSGTHGAA